jgi:hypothetical protein
MKNAAVVLLLLAVSGCGKRDESIAKKVGEKVGETATDFATGAGQVWSRSSCASHSARM